MHLFKVLKDYLFLLIYFAYTIAAGDNADQEAGIKE